MAVFRKAIVNTWDKMELNLSNLSQPNSVWELGEVIVVEWWLWLIKMFQKDVQRCPEPMDYIIIASRHPLEPPVSIP
jgi:hypothetical protein